MKKAMVFIAALLLAKSMEAKIWRINNVGGIIADFTTAQAANDHASVLNGDTLHLEPSTISYGNLTLTKRLTIISIGDFLSSSPNTQYAPVSGKLNSVTIQNVNANGSVLHCNTGNSINISGVNNIRIERCRIESGIDINSASSILILNNFVSSTIYVNLNCTSIGIHNNILQALSMHVTSSAVISNNVFQAVLNSIINASIYNSTFQNNIINKNNLSFTFVNSSVVNNLGPNANSFPAGNGNINNVNMATVFVNPAGTDDQSFKLQTAGANPAVAYGVGGIDCGAFGGSSAFKNALQPAIPSIYKLTAPLNPSGSSMTVTFSTRSNN